MRSLRGRKQTSGAVAKISCSVLLTYFSLPIHRLELPSTLSCSLTVFGLTAYRSCYYISPWHSLHNRLPIACISTSTPPVAPSRTLHSLPLDSIVFTPHLIQAHIHYGAH